MPRVLFICTGNSARSQMAEALLRDIGGEEYEVYSAGTAPQNEVNPFAIEVLQERGISVDGLKPKRVESLGEEHFDIVVTVCDNARETCPFYPYANQTLHWSLEDPAAFQGSYAEILFKFREIRDDIERRIRKFILKQ